MRATKGSTKTSPDAGVEQIGIRTAIEVVGDGRAGDDGTDCPRSLCGSPKFPPGL